MGFPTKPCHFYKKFPVETQSHLIFADGEVLEKSLLWEALDDQLPQQIAWVE